MKWTPEQNQTALKMKSEGADLLTIAKALNKSHRAVRFHLRYLSLSKEQRQHENLTKRLARTPAERKLVRRRVSPPNTEFVPAHVLEDRERRMSAAQPAFGDPPVGFSALDRRNTGEMRA